MQDQGERIIKRKTKESMKKVKERPILFSTPMVQALLAGRKTQTRRIAKVPQGDHMGTDIMDWALSEHPTLHEGEWKYTVQTAVDDSRTEILKCPYGSVGDILWVRETWQYAGDTDYYFYKAGRNYHLPMNMENIPKEEDYKFRPSIFMPRAACRIKLEITDIRVERLGEISEEDIESEGIEMETCTTCGGLMNYAAGGQNIECEECPNPKEIFQSLWTKINGTYDPSIWVWAITFKLIP